MKNYKGYTLIEVIISIAILGIIAIVVLEVFGSGLKNIVRAGDRTEVVYQEQKLLDEKIDDYSSALGSDIEIEVKFDDYLKINIQGKILTSSENDLNIKAFIPKP